MLNVELSVFYDHNNLQEMYRSGSFVNLTNILTIYYDVQWIWPMDKLFNSNKLVKTRSVSLAYILMGGERFKIHSKYSPS